MLDILISTIGFLHVMFAIYLIGGGFFFEFISKPQLMANLSPPDAGKVIMASGQKFTILVYIAWAVIVVSGLYRVFFYMDYINHFDWFWTTDYGLVLVVKMLVVVVAFIITLLITRTSKIIASLSPPERAPFVKKVSLYSRIQAVVGIVIIFLAVTLRNGI